MTPQKQLRKRLDRLDSGDDGDGDGDGGGMEITITDHVAPSEWGDGPDEGAPEPVSRLRCWEDENGEWQSERTDLRDGDGDQ